MLPAPCHSDMEMKTALAILAALLVMAFALAVWGEPDSYSDPMDTPAPNMRRAQEGECIWTFVDMADMRSDLMPGKPPLTQETRTRLCYFGWTYSLSTFQRFVDPHGKPVTNWQAIRWAGDGYTTTIYLGISESGKPAGPPPWGADVFKFADRLPE